MTGEELNRKYWEMEGYWADKQQGPTWFPAPPLHLDANLAIAEAKKTFNWFRLAVEPDRVVFVRLEIAVEGKDICEAILKALIAAGEK